MMESLCKAVSIPNIAQSSCYVAKVSLFHETGYK